MAAVGLALRGSTWILPDGLLGGGVALILMAPFVRGALDVIVTLSPFMFYTLSPVGGILTVGLVRHPAAGRRGRAWWSPAWWRRRLPDTLPRLSAAAPMMILSAVLVTASICVWTIADPDFLAKRAIADAMKLGIGVAYFMVTYVLARPGRPGHDDAGVPDLGLDRHRPLGRLAGGHHRRRRARSRPTATAPTATSRTPTSTPATCSCRCRSCCSWPPSRPAPWLPFQALVMTGGIVTTGSRAGLASLLLLFVLALVVIRSARLRGMLIGVMAVSVLAAGWLVVNRGSGTSILGLDRLFFASADVNDDPRLSLWSLAIEKWLDAPIWGIGLGQFERFSGDAFRTARSSGLGYVTHNTFLFFLVAFGVIGLGLFLWMMVWVVVRLYAAPGLSRNSKHALMSGVVVLASQMMTLNLQNLRYVWVYFGLVLGLSVVAWAAPGDEAEDAP